MDSATFYDVVELLFANDILQVSALFAAFITVMTVITLSIQHFNDMR